MIRLPHPSVPILAMALAILASTAAAAPVQRTFVSTGGSDVNACSVTLPCRSFGAAITQTLDNGEIIVLDSGGYGPVVINKSIEIIAPPGVYAGITASAGTGIQIVSPAQNVAIRGVAINGLGTGQFGIDVQFGAQITVERCRIANFTQDGVRFTGATVLVLRDSDIRENGGGGLNITTGSHTIERSTFRHNATGVNVNGSATVALSDPVVVANLVVGVRIADTSLVTITGGQISNNAGHGVHLDGNVASAFTRVAIDGTTISNNSSAGVFASATSTNAFLQLAIARSLFIENFSGVAGGTSAAGAAAHLVVSDSVLERNAQGGLSISGTNADLTISNNVVTGSSQGVAKFSGGIVFTRQSSTVRGNTTDVVNGPFTNIGGI